MASGKGSTQTDRRRPASRKLNSPDKRPCGLGRLYRLRALLRLDAVRAHLLEMDGEAGAAIMHYRLAAGRTTSLAERDYLTAKAARLAARL